MTGLDRLQDAKQCLRKRRRKDDSNVRGLVRSGPLQFQMHEEQFLVEAINELWDLVCDVAERRCNERIRVTAEQMRREAEKALQ